MTKTHEEQADEFVEMFRPHSKTWDCYHDVHDENQHDTKCAIKHVEGLISLADKYIKLYDFQSEDTISDDKDNLTSVKAVLEQRINK